MYFITLPSAQKGTSYHQLLILRAILSPTEDKAWQS